MSEISTSSAVPVRSRSPIHHPPSTERKRHESIICKPLDTLSDIEEFLNDPPAWRSLCIELRPHSDYAIKNIDLVRQNHAGLGQEVEVERPETFCHFASDNKDVRRHRRKDLPRTLVCHDMANGYHDDCNIDGTGNYEAYTFYNWAAVDIFCYFSHHFITIPPLGWINVAHAHGVQVLGTVITEWGDGASVWEKLLAAPEHWQEFAASLVAIAKMLKFDGWLLNIENKISKPTELISFVRHLHELMHREMSSPLLLWYDSVTSAGELAWQNGLNHHNKDFFSACDGIFTNYSWSAGHVADSAAAAGARRRDVFVGVDVWGRNFIGGGMFNTQEAVKIAHSHGCSLAIFAPAWTHEAMDSASITQFRLRELALWASLWPFLNTKLPRQLPFSTSFCTGQGRKRRLYGEVLGPVPWYNLRHQQYQPNSAVGPHGYVLTAENPEPNVKRIVEKSKDEQNEVDAPEPKPALPPNTTLSDEKPAKTPKSYTRYQLLPVKDSPCLSLHLSDSFTGGGCLLINLPGDTSNQLIRLFHCDFTIQDTLVACVVTKTLPEHDDQILNLILDIDDGRRVALVGASGGDAGIPDVLAVYPATGSGFKDVQRYLLLNQPGFYVSVENSYGWKVRYYSVRLSGARVTSLSCGGGARAPLLLGRLGLCHRYEEKTEETN